MKQLFEKTMIPKGWDSLFGAALELGVPRRKQEWFRFNDLSRLEKSFDFSKLNEQVVNVSGDIEHADWKSILEGEKVTLESCWPTQQLAQIMSLSVEGAALRVPAKGKAQISCIHDLNNVVQNVVVILEEGATLDIVENYDGKSSATNLLVVAKDNTHIVHSRCVRGGHLGSFGAHLGANANYQGRGLSLENDVARYDLRLVLADKGAEAEVSAAYLASGKCEIDHHFLIEHRAPHCRSEQHVRGVAKDDAVFIYDGKTIVGEGAHHSEAHQQNKNVLLSDSARVHTKPHLEIDNDDVVASHGATVGAMDDDALFYLLSRGVSKTQAKNMLVSAFLVELLDEELAEKAGEGIDELFAGDKA